jgi:HSP20 family molecular chaperone IbpA
MPGVKAEDLNVELVDRSLVIEGERKATTRTNPISGKKGNSELLKNP